MQVLEVVGLEVGVDGLALGLYGRPLVEEVVSQWHDRRRTGGHIILTEVLYNYLNLIGLNLRQVGIVVALGWLGRHKVMAVQSPAHWLLCRLGDAHLDSVRLYRHRRLLNGEEAL